MTIGKKKKKKNMTIDRRHRFDSIGSITDSSNTVVEVIDPMAVVEATIATISSPMMVVQWSEIPIRWAVTKATILVVWASAVFVEATILTTCPPMGTTIRRYGGRQDQFGNVCQSHYFGGSAIGPPPQTAPLAEPPMLVVYLKYKFKLKKV